MAKTEDIPYIMLEGGTKIPLNRLPSKDEASTEIIVRSYKSDDGKYMYQDVVRVIYLGNDTPKKNDEQYHRQAQFIRSLFSQYIDFKKSDELCEKLTDLLAEGKIEYQSDMQGNSYVNIKRGKGQRDLFSLLIDHMTSQKKEALHGKESFRDFKKTLRKHVRHFGKTLDNNSLGITLHRLIDKT